MGLREYSTLSSVSSERDSVAFAMSASLMPSFLFDLIFSILQCLVVVLINARVSPAYQAGMVREHFSPSILLILGFWSCLCS